MGNCFSDPSTKPKGKGQVLGSGPKPSSTNPTSSTTNTGSIAKKQNYQGSSPATLGGSAGEQGSERERALAAAEERAKAVSQSELQRASFSSSSSSFSLPPYLIVLLPDSFAPLSSLRVLEESEMRMKH
jgi:hypothetical protein